MGGGKKQRSKRAPRAAAPRALLEAEELSSSCIVSSQVDDCPEEMRFLWLDYESNQSDFGSKSSFSSSPTYLKSDLTKHGDRHQVNYGATKYIKP